MVIVIVIPTCVYREMQQHQYHLVVFVVDRGQHGCMDSDRFVAMQPRTQ